MKNLVIKLSGSLFHTNQREFKAYVHGINSIVSGLKRYRLAFVTGGGKTAGAYVDLARAVGISPYYQDLLGITASRLNAKLLALSMKAWPIIPESVDEAVVISRSGGIPVMGGTVPGHTTNAVSVLLSEALGAKLINLTTVDGIYDSDPAKNPKAKLIPRMTHSQLVKMASKYDSRGAREHFVFDLLAAKIAERSNIEVIIANGKDLNNLRKIISGKKFRGTLIRD